MLGDLIGGPFVSRGNSWLSSQGGSEAGRPQPSVVREGAQGAGKAPPLFEQTAPSPKSETPAASVSPEEDWNLGDVHGTYFCLLNGFYFLLNWNGSTIYVNDETV